MIRTLVALLLLSACASSGDQNNSTSSDGEITFVTSFDYQPETPINGQQLGIIELGYTGFNSFMVNMDNRDRWSLEKANYSESYVGDGKVTLEHVLNKIDHFKQDMIQHGVQEYNISFVASSSAVKNDRVLEIIERLRQMDLGVITVNAEQEGYYAHYATIPEKFAENSFMVDIGSGNTKITWIDKGEIKTIESYGSKYYQQEIPMEEARNGIKRALWEVPDKNKNLCFLVGKIPYLLATASNNRDGRYSILEAPDTYEFKDEQELAGLNLYHAIWNKETIAHVFDWDSNFSIGVLMAVN